jgi:hypothetical protein
MPLPLSPSRRRLPPRSLLRRPGGQERSAGLLLPLTALISLLLLLGSLSVHAVSLQGRLRGDSELRLQTSEDQLHSAAQQLVDRLQQRHACLLPLALEHWAAADCASAAELSQLRQGEVFGAGWQLRRWQPDADDPGLAATSERRLTLEISLNPSDRDSARRGGFVVRLAGLPWRVMELRPLGLRGEAP